MCYQNHFNSRVKKVFVNDNYGLFFATNSDLSSDLSNKQWNWQYNKTVENPKRRRKNHFDVIIHISNSNLWIDQCLCTLNFAEAFETSEMLYYIRTPKVLWTAQRTNRARCFRCWINKTHRRAISFNDKSCNFLVVQLEETMQKNKAWLYAVSCIDKKNANFSVTYKKIKS